MENSVEQVQTPEEKAIDLVEKTFGEKPSPIALADGEEIVASYDFPTIFEESELSHEVYLTTNRFVHLEKSADKKRRTKKVSAFSIQEIDCIDSVVSRHKNISWPLVVLFLLFVVASIVVGLTVTYFAFGGVAVFGLFTILALVLPKERRVFSLLISSLSEQGETHEVMTLGALTFRDVKGDELESGEVIVNEGADFGVLDDIVSEIGAKVIEIKECRQ